MTLHSSYSLHGGSLGAESWDSKMYFERYTWKREIKSIFDVYLTQIDSNDNFYKWFGTSVDCQNVIIALSNSSSRFLNSTDFNTEMKKQGLKPFTDNYFKKNLMMHDNAKTWKLDSYRVDMFCSDTRKMSLDIDLPGYEIEKIEFRK